MDRGPCTLLELTASSFFHCSNSFAPWRSKQFSAGICCHLMIWKTCLSTAGCIVHNKLQQRRNGGRLFYPISCCAVLRSGIMNNMLSPCSRCETASPRRSWCRKSSTAPKYRTQNMANDYWLFFYLGKLHPEASPLEQNEHP